MLSATQAIGFAYSMMPSIALDSPINMARKCTSIALPLIGLVALNGIPTVSAGPAAYASCVAICLASTLGAFPPACAAACAPAFLAPTP